MTEELSSGSPASMVGAVAYGSGAFGDRWFLSTVRYPRTPEGKPDPEAAGQGFLIELAREGDVGIEKGRLELCDGLVYHPGGLTADGETIYVPVSEYRPDSSAHIYKVDVETFEISLL